MKKLPFLLFFALCLCLCACAANEPAAGSPPEPVVINVYYGDDNCEYIISEAVSVSEIAPEYIIEALFDKSVISEPVSVNSFLMDKTGVISLDLDGAFGRMISAMGTSGEYIMMGALVNSFLDAYDAAELVLLVDGKILETGHCIYDAPMGFFE